MKNPIWYTKNLKEPQEGHNNVEHNHKTVNYIDNSNSVAVFDKSDENNFYVDRYF